MNETKTSILKVLFPTGIPVEMIESIDDICSDVDQLINKCSFNNTNQESEVAKSTDESGTSESDTYGPVENGPDETEVEPSTQENGDPGEPADTTNDTAEPEPTINFQEREPPENPQWKKNSYEKKDLNSGIIKIRETSGCILYTKFEDLVDLYDQLPEKTRFKDMPIKYQKAKAIFEYFNKHPNFDCEYSRGLLTKKDVETFSVGVDTRAPVVESGESQGVTG